MNRHFTKKNIRMENKHMKRYSIYLTIGVNGFNESSEFVGLTCSYNEDYKNYCQIQFNIVIRQHIVNTVQSPHSTYCRYQVRNPICQYPFYCDKQHNFSIRCSIIQKNADFIYEMKVTIEKN